ncbi:hypothetical protein BRADI_1g44675v3 [Brachypodium distachyon]|uniref:Uncharacterized protein n=1 Tax=Brachypodium distachyon TaxID=15368 RepID=A0A2K2DPC6_BRADI|nr:hypothetical protein BRADI_1g44675v3 [Brachypodium distachyon]
MDLKSDNPRRVVWCLSLGATSSICLDTTESPRRTALPPPVTKLGRDPGALDRTGTSVPSGHSPSPLPPCPPRLHCSPSRRTAVAAVPKSPILHHIAVPKSRILHYVARPLQPAALQALAASCSQQPNQGDRA